MGPNDAGDYGMEARALIRDDVHQTPQFGHKVFKGKRERIQTVEFLAYVPGKAGVQYRVYTGNTKEELRQTGESPLQTHFLRMRRNRT